MTGSIDRRAFVTGAAAALAAGSTGCSWWKSERRARPVSVTKNPFGHVLGRPASLYRLRNADGMEVAITDYGAIVTEVLVPGKDGQRADVVLGFDVLESYLEGHPYFGCIAGRCANRIAGGRFTLDGKEYVLARNAGEHHLHGGEIGFDKQLWSGGIVERADASSVVLTRLSPDGEEGYPGNLAVNVVYTLTDSSELRVEMTATTDAPTLCNLVHHSYWNLAGHDSGTILGHELELPCSHYTATDAELIPTGKLKEVRGSEYDFTIRKAIGRDIRILANDTIMGHGGGYDVNYAVDGADGMMRTCAKLRDPASGRAMEILADQPGIQFYTGNFLDGSLRGKRGAVYGKHQGLCLETQKYPDAIHHPNFPSVVVRPGDTYRHAMIHRFSW
jgi:aldose 1-epimerase